MFNRTANEKILAENLKLASDSALITGLEEAIYNKALFISAQNNVSLEDIYRAITYRLLVNLSPNSTLNKGSQTKCYVDFINGDIPPAELVNLSNSKLHYNSDEVCKIIELRKNSVVAEKYSTEFNCSRCRGNKCREYRDQTRSGDEGYTYKVECLTCGNKWVLR